MREQDFIDPAGQIIPTLSGHRAFLPARLPPALDLAQHMEPIATCIQKLGELKGAAKLTENPYMLIGPLQRREALATSAMEGTHTSIEKLILSEDAVTNERDSATQETFNYIVALTHAVENLKKLPISHRIIKDSHARLFAYLSHERGAGKRPGEYKQTQNWIGGTRDITTARYVPPPPEHTQQCMDQIESYMNQENVGTAQKLLDLALVHYQFEAIHPFEDGNGRIGRLLVTLLALQSKLLDLPILFVSPYLERKKDEYIDRMYDVTTQSKWTEWINFFLEAVAVTCDDTTQKIESLLQLQKSYRTKAAQVGRSSKLIEVIDQLFQHPAITVPKVEKQFGITYRAAQQIVDKLVQAGILTERSGHYPKYFVATEILRTANRD
jgi:Fic family protein